MSKSFVAALPRTEVPVAARPRAAQAPSGFAGLSRTGRFGNPPSSYSCPVPLPATSPAQTAALLRIAGPASVRAVQSHTPRSLPGFQPARHAPVPVQRKAAGSRPAPASSLPAAGSGKAMPGDVRAKMEGAFGVDFSRVRIHEDARPEALGALAYTNGTDVHFAPGQYQPDSQRGQALLGHELTHVVQQSRGTVAATTQTKGVGVNDDAGLEREADEMGARAARGQRVELGTWARGGAAGVGAGSVQRAVVQLQRAQLATTTTGYNTDWERRQIAAGSYEIVEQTPDGWTKIQVGRYLRWVRTSAISEAGGRDGAVDRTGLPFGALVADSLRPGDDKVEIALGATSEPTLWGNVFNSIDEATASMRDGTTTSSGALGAARATWEAGRQRVNANGLKVTYFKNRAGQWQPRMPNGQFTSNRVVSGSFNQLGRAASRGGVIGAAVGVGFTALDVVIRIGRGEEWRDVLSDRQTWEGLASRAVTGAATGAIGAAVGTAVSGALAAGALGATLGAWAGPIGMAVGALVAIGVGLLIDWLDEVGFWDWLGQAFTDLGNAIYEAASGVWRWMTGS